MHWGDAEIRFSDIINVNEFQRHAPQLFEILPMSWYLHDAFVGLFMWYGNKDTWREQVVPDFLTQGAILVPQPNLMDTLIQSSRRDVTDLRDYIYALLGHPLAVLGDNTIVQADYERHVDDVYMEVTTKLLQYLEPSLPLSVAGGMGKKRPRNLDDDQPSWVVRWDLGMETHNLGRPGQWFYAGGKDVKPSVAIDTEAKTLTVPAVVFDKVKWFSDKIPAPEVEINSIIKNPEHRAAMQWLWDTLPSDSRYPDEEARRDAFTLCLVSGRYKHTTVAEDDMVFHRRIATAYSEYLKSVQEGTPSDEKLRAEARDFENDYTWTARERRFFVTERGFYGIGPPLVKVGDVIAVPQGFMIPYVLRATKDENKYKLVGAAFVQGIMRGEVLDEKDPLGLGLGAGGPKDIVIV
jgi:hypothetical protein